MKHPSVQQIPRNGTSRKKIKRYTVRHLRAIREASTPIATSKARDERW